MCTFYCIAPPRERDVGAAAGTVAEPAPAAAAALCCGSEGAVSVLAAGPEPVSSGTRSHASEAAASAAVAASVACVGGVPAPTSGVPWWADVSFDHNHLRITRILRSLRLFGLGEEAAALHAELVAVARAGAVNRRSLSYWQRAVSEPLFSTLQ